MAQKTPVHVLPNAWFRLFFDVMEQGGLGSFFGRKIKLYPHSIVLLPAIRVKLLTAFENPCSTYRSARYFHAVIAYADPIRSLRIRRVSAVMVSIKLMGDRSRSAEPSQGGTSRSTDCLDRPDPATAGLKAPIKILSSAYWAVYKQNALEASRTY